ncbi:MAG: DNA polymerase III subunit alpha [Gammaproteobacteria bacterium]|nr:DNA polymerase III subunit alpha [Gammaproteobacteria bacterium]
MSSANTFVHLHVQTEYSLSNSVLRIKGLMSAVPERGMAAVAMTDRCNIYAAVKFFKAAIDHGIKPIIGVDLPIVRLDQQGRTHRLTLLTMDRDGYRNLCELVTEAYARQQEYGVPALARESLSGRTQGLIALSGAQEGELGQALASGANRKRVDGLLSAYTTLFPDRFYIETRRVGLSGEGAYNEAAVHTARRGGLPVVATNSVQFIDPSEHENHEVRVCIHDGRILNDSRRPTKYTDQQYLRTPAEMQALFSDCPEAVANSVEIAKRCNFALEFGDYFLPHFTVPEGRTAESYLAEKAREGLVRRLSDAAGVDREEYEARLEKELGVISQMGFPGYFLIVADFISWAKKNDIPVGPGRGSGAGSLVAWVLGITELDPIYHGLLFERFLNPERVSLPDFDIDFCMAGRDRVIEYVADYYGRDKVAQIITYGTMAARAVVRDVGRVMGLSYGYVDKIAKLVPFQVGMTLDAALEQEELLRDRYEQDEEVRQLIDTAGALEGLARNVGRHAGGVVIAPSRLTEFAPLYCERGSEQPLTQFDKDDLEAIGLVKFDFLGLRTLTIIARAIDRINRRKRNGDGPPVDLDSMPLDDPDTYELIKSGRTTSLFQLESRGMKDLIKRLSPDNFQDLVALVALFRPGPLQSGMVDDFIDRKHGRQALSYQHPLLEPVLKPTYGVILYQEQVMEIARVLGGYSLGAADLLRRAMGKKKPEEMARQREVFQNGARDRKVDPDTASTIFDLMEKFAGYGFNKSHSAAYALLTYQTAWLKAHYPSEFMAAALSSDMDNTDRVVDLISDCRDMGIDVLPPNVNTGWYSFETNGEGAILYGLGAIKGLGQGVIEAVVEARSDGGPFRDLFDFCERVDPRRLNKRALESLIGAGAADPLGPHRAALLATMPTALELAQQRNRSEGQGELFGEQSGSDQVRRFRDVAPWNKEKMLTAERETLGLYFSGHPIDRHRRYLDRIVDASLRDLKPTSDRNVTVGGLISAIRTMNTRRGDRMAFVTLDDQTARVELAVFSDLYGEKREAIRKDNLVVVYGEVKVDEYTGGFKMSAEKLYDWDEARLAFTSRVVLRLENGEIRRGRNIDRLRELVAEHGRGNVPLWIQYANDEAEGLLKLGPDWHVRPTTAFVEALMEAFGDDRVEVVFNPRIDHTESSDVDHAA